MNAGDYEESKGDRQQQVRCDRSDSCTEEPAPPPLQKPVKECNQGVEESLASNGEQHTVDEYVHPPQQIGPDGHVRSRRKNHGQEEPQIFLLAPSAPEESQRGQSRQKLKKR